MSFRRSAASERGRAPEQGVLELPQAEGIGVATAMARERRRPYGPPVEPGAERASPAGAAAWSEALGLQREVLAALPGAVVVTDGEERVRYWSPGAEALYGLPADAILGRPLSVVCRPKWADRDDEIDVARSLAETGAWQGEHVEVLADGRERLVDCALKIFSRSGGARYLLRHVHDVTDRCQARRERLAAERMEAVGRLAGGIAHDFNNLLMGILGCVRLAGEAVPEEAAARRYLDEIKRAAERGAGLTRDLLLYSRRAHGAPKPLRLALVLEGLEPEIERLAGERVTVEMRSCASGGPVIADSLQLETLVLQLCANACAAMPEGGRLELEVDDVALDASEARALGAEPGSFVRLTVRDTGCGMDADTQAKLYEPFFTTRGESSTGLGLSIVYGIMQQLGGFIRVESEPGSGSCFALHFPRNPAAEGASVTPDRIAEKGSRGETILVVEDDPLVRMTVHHFLASAGYDVLEAEASDEALRIGLEEQRPIHLLVTDMVLPGMSGRDLARELRRHRPELKVIFMSAYPNDMLVEQKRLEAGVPSIEKPFTEEVLVAAVHEVLRDGA